MNHQEVKRILRSCRHGGRDSHDPLFKEALAEVKRDPVLAKWYGEEQTLDSCIALKLQAAAPIPLELRTKLVEARNRPRSVKRSRRHVWISVAAAASVAALAVNLLRIESPAQHAFDLAEFQEAMIHDAKSAGSQASLEASDIQWIMHWLAEQGAASTPPLPAALHDDPGPACRVLDWHGLKVSLVRFLLAGNRHVDLFVVDPAGLWGSVLPSAPQFAGSDQLRTASWRCGSKVILVTGSGTEAELRRLLWSQLPLTPEI